MLQATHLEEQEEPICFGKRSESGGIPRQLLISSHGCKGDAIPKDLM